MFKVKKKQKEKKKNKKRKKEKIPKKLWQIKKQIRTGKNNIPNAVIFAQTPILQALWYFWRRPLKTLMSKMLARVV